MRGGTRFLRIGLILMLVAASAFLVGCQDLLSLANSKDPGTIQGTVRDAVTQNVLTVVVYVESDDGVSTTTGNGAYRLDNVEAGSRTVTFNAQGYQQYSRTVNVGSGETFTLDAYLQPFTVGTGSISGTIMESGSNNTVTAQVTVSTDDGKSTSTNSGSFFIDGVSVGTRTLSVNSSGYQPYSVTVQVNANQTSSVQIYLTPTTAQTGEIHGTVYDANSNMPLAGATISAESGASTVTDGSGYYTMSMLPGNYNLTASRSGYESQTLNVTVNSNTSVQYDFYLGSGGSNSATVRGYVLEDMSGAPIQGAMVTSDDGATTYTDQNGAYVMTVGPGDRMLTASAANYNSSSMQQYLNPGQDLQLNFWLTQMGMDKAHVVGQVNDYMTGNPIANAYVYCDDGTSGMTDSNGTFEFDVNQGLRSFYITAEGYYDGYAEQYCYTGTSNYVYVSMQQTTTGMGTVEGNITDAVTNLPLPGVQIYTDDGYYTTTDDSGYFSLQVNAGQRQIYGYLEGYYDVSQDVYVDMDMSTYVTLSMSPVMAQGSGAYRIVLTWGGEPSDLDSHLFTPMMSDGLYYHIWYGGMGSETDVPYATLDVDDTDGYGPETITIHQLVDGTYTYFVYRFSGDPAVPLAGCGATVNIYNENGLVDQVTVPSSGDGDWWKVCTINGGIVNVYNQIQIDDPTSTLTTTSRGPVRVKMP